MESMCCASVTFVCSTFAKNRNSRHSGRILAIFTAIEPSSAVDEIPWPPVVITQTRNTHRRKMVVGRSGLTIDLQNFELRKHAQSDKHAQSTNDQQTKA